MGIRNQLNELSDERMNENKFWGYVLDGADNGFQYGRDIIKEGTYEAMLKIPYNEFPLFTKPSWYGDKTA